MEAWKNDLHQPLLILHKTGHTEWKLSFKFFRPEIGFYSDGLVLDHEPTEADKGIVLEMVREAMTHLGVTDYRILELDMVRQGL